MNALTAYRNLRRAQCARVWLLGFILLGTAVVTLFLGGLDLDWNNARQLLVQVRLPRLFAALDALHACGRDTSAVLGTVDALKLRSCLTLMLAAAPGDPRLTRALAQWFDGQPDPLTQALLRG